MFFISRGLVGFQLLCAVCVYAIAKQRTAESLLGATVLGVFGVLFLTASCNSPLVFLQGITLELL